MRSVAAWLFSHPVLTLVPALEDHVLGLALLNAIVPQTKPGAALFEATQEIVPLVPKSSVKCKIVFSFDVTVIFVLPRAKFIKSRAAVHPVDICRAIKEDTVVVTVADVGVCQDMKKFAFALPHNADRNGEKR